MENKNTLVVVLLTLIIGFGVGYFAYPNNSGMRGGIQECMGQGGMTQSGDMQEMMHGMLMGMSGKTGDALDLAFLDEMIAHHEGAIAMAEALLAETKRPELITLGNNIITAQKGEIDMMKKWRAEWFGR